MSALSSETPHGYSPQKRKTHLVSSKPFRCCSATAWQAVQQLLKHIFGR